MTKAELLKRTEDDPVPLSDEIREGLIPFDLLTRVIKDNKDIVPIIKISHLIHPDCTIEVFKRNYFSVLDETQWLARETIFFNSPIFRHLEAIAFVISCKVVSYEAIKETYKASNFAFDRLIKNPHIPAEFRVMYFELTGDSSVLPKDTQDCFVF